MATSYWLTVGLAAILGAILGAIVSVWTVTRTIRHKSVIEERQKWRDTLRELVPNLISTADASERVRIRNAVALRLNPNDDADVRAVESIDGFLADSSQRRGLEIVEMFQRLFKLDWERAKIEASFRPWCAVRRATKRIGKQEIEQKQKEMARKQEQQTASIRD